AFGEESFDKGNLTEILNAQNTRIQEKIESRISRLPSLNKERIGNTDLSSETVQEIQNVIGITEKYNNEFGQVAHRIDNDPILPDHIYALKKHLHENGVTLTDTIKLPESENLPESTSVKFEIDNIPKGFEIKNLQLPNSEKVNWKNDKITFPYQSGEFTVNLTLKLKDINADIG